MSMRASSVLAVALATLALPRPAMAGPDEPAASDRAIEEARVRFQKGVQLYKEGSFEGALAEFRRAYQLAPSYRLLYNIGQVQFELHDHVEALKAFRQYLAEGGSEIPTDRRTQVEADIQKLEGRVAYLDISTNVDGAQVSVDDVPVGVSPLRGAVLVNAGPRRVAVSKAGRGATARNVTVAGGDRVKISLDMSDAPPSQKAADSAATKKPPGGAEAAPSPNRTGVWVGLAATGAFAVGTGAFALLTRDAKSEFDRELEKYPTTRERIDDARARMKTYAGITDGFGAATIVSGGVTIFLALSSGGNKASTQQGKPTIHVAPRVGGISVMGDF
jgi:tetratricopeptide (TPR) repeat protein